MPKLKKEKFEFNGKYISAQTTFPGDIELYSYYDVSGDFFYFDLKEIRQKFPNFKINDIGLLILTDEDEEVERKVPENYRHLDFRNCRTKYQAVAVMKAFLKDYTKTKRMLRVELELQGNFPNVDGNKFSNHLKKMTRWFRNKQKDESKFGIKIERVLQIQVGNSFAYEECDEDWNQLGRLHSHDRDLIEWDEKTEAFLIGMQNEVNNICLKIIDFFNTKTFEELKLKMENNKLLNT